MGSEKSRARIIGAVIGMLNEGVGEEGLKTREIARRAGVGIGLINYHFQTKEKLIDAALERFTDGLEQTLSETLSGAEGTAKQRLKNLSKTALDYLAENPLVGKMAIRRSSLDGNGTGLLRIMNLVKPLIAEITGADAYWTQLILNLILFNYEGSFLQAESIRQTSGFDFYDPAGRARYSDDVIETILQDIL